MSVDIVFEVLTVIEREQSIYRCLCNVHFTWLLVKLGIELEQWFPTTVPRHISVPRNDYWCAAKRSSKQKKKK